jgi:hypothetical protein
VGEHVLVEAQFELGMVIADAAQGRQVGDVDGGEGAEGWTVEAPAVHLLLGVFAAVNEINKNGHGGIQSIKKSEGGSAGQGPAKGSCLCAGIAAMRETFDGLGFEPIKNGTHGRGIDAPGGNTAVEAKAALAERAVIVEHR